MTTKDEMDRWMKAVIGDLVNTRKKMIRKGWIKEGKEKVIFT